MEENEYTIKFHYDDGAFDNLNDQPAHRIMLQELTHVLARDARLQSY
jgi:hypothetical protein